MYQSQYAKCSYFICFISCEINVVLTYNAVWSFSCLDFRAFTIMDINSSVGEQHLNVLFSTLFNPNEFMRQPLSSTQEAIHNFYLLNNCALPFFCLDKTMLKYLNITICKYFNIKAKIHYCLENTDKRNYIL